MLLNSGRVSQRRTDALELNLWPVHFDFVANVDTHQVLADFQGAGVRLPSMRNHIRNVGWDNVRIDRELWLHASKNRSSLLRSGVMLDYFLPLRERV